MDKRCNPKSRIGWIVSIVCIIAIILLRIFFFFVYQAPNDRYRTIRTGKVMIMNKRGTPLRESYALVKPKVADGSAPSLVRVVACQGDTVLLRKDTLWVNQRPYPLMDKSPIGKSLQWVLPPHTFWVMSESLQGMDDSCFRGPLRLSDFYAIAL